jgi:3-oxoacyl-[acyl-carrier protein] reductase
MTREKVHMSEDNGRCLLVTGATGATGEHVARRLLARGDRLVLTGRDRVRLDELERALASDHVLAVACDVSEPGGAELAVEQGRARFGALDGCVSLAGSFRAGTPVFVADADVYTELYAANVLTAALASRAVLRQLDGPGWFVYLTSLLAREPMPSTGPYAASKAALTAWARAFSREVRDRGVHVNVIASSVINTPANRDRQPGLDYGQWVPVEDVAEVIAFLTSPASAGMHGSEVDVLGKFALYPPPGAVAAGPPNPPRAKTKRYALRYPFLPGRAAEAEELFRGGGDPPPQGGRTRLLTTTVFRTGDQVIRTFEIDGELDEAIEHMVKATALSDLGAKLTPLLADGTDLTTEDGLRAFFREQLMEIVIDRAGPPPGVPGGPPASANGASR